MHMIIQRTGLAMAQDGLAAEWVKRLKMEHQRDIQRGASEARRQPFSRNGGRAAKPVYARRSFLFLTLIMVVSCATVMAVITASLYRNEIREQREMLQVSNSPCRKHR